MIDKEQIIIDGIDVSGCILRRRKEPNCIVCNGYSSKVFEFDCSDFKNCYFKQLKRKEQECERLKNELSTYGATGICETCTEKSVLKCGQLEAENEELKKELDKEHLLMLEKQDKLVKYILVFDEIAEHYKKVMENITTYDDNHDANISIKALHNISDIINKAKDSKND